MCTKEQPEDNKLICITINALSMEDLTTFKLTVFTRMDAAATIIFVPGKMRHLSEGGYYSRVASIRGMCMRVLLSIYDIYYSATNMASQGKWTKHSVSTALCVGTMSTRWCGLLFLGEVLTATPEPKNDHNRHFVCVCEGWRNRWPRTTH